MMDRKKHRSIVEAAIKNGFLFLPGSGGWKAFDNYYTYCLKTHKPFWCLCVWRKRAKITYDFWPTEWNWSNEAVELIEQKAKELLLEVAKTLSPSTLRKLWVTVGVTYGVIYCLPSKAGALLEELQRLFHTPGMIRYHRDDLYPNLQPS